MEQFKVKVSSKIATTQEIYCHTSYDKAQKLAEKIAEEQIEFICQEFKVEKKDLKIDFEPSSYRLKIVYENDFTKIEKIIKVEEYQ